MMPPAPLKVTIMSAQGLRKTSSIGELDTFCTCEVHGKPHSRFQTQVYEDDRDPVWNFESVLMDYCLGDALLFQVYEEGTRNVDTILGSALLRAPQLHSLAFEGMLTLVDEVDASRATLSVKVGCFVPSFGPGFVGPGAVGGGMFGAASFGRPVSPFQARPASPFQAAVPMSPPQFDTRPPSPFAAAPPQVAVAAPAAAAAAAPALVTPPVKSRSIVSPPVETVMEPIASKPASQPMTTTTYATPASVHGPTSSSLVTLGPTYASPAPAVAASGTATPPFITTPPVAMAAVMPAHQVKITVVSANGLRKARWMSGTSDPYVQGEISGKPHTRFTTPTLQSSLDPVWNFEHALKDYSPGDSITFTVYDKGSSNDGDHLGRGVLHGKLFDPAAGAPGPGFNGLLVLTQSNENRGPEPNAMLTVRVDLSAAAASSNLVASRAPMSFSREADDVARARGGRQEPTALAVQSVGLPAASSIAAAAPTRMLSSSSLAPLGSAGSAALCQTQAPVSMGSMQAPAGLPHASARSMVPSSPLHVGAAGSVPLKVTMLSAQGLSRPGWFASPPEACCVCEVKGRPRTRFQTHVETDADPVWEYPEVLTEFIPGDTLTFSVYDEGEGTTGDRLLGRATLPSNRFYPQGFDGTLVLAEAGKGARATVAVRVDVVGAAQPLGGVVHQSSSASRMSAYGVASLASSGPQQQSGFPNPFGSTTTSIAGVHGMDQLLPVSQQVTPNGTVMTLPTNLGAWPAPASAPIGASSWPYGARR